MSFTNQPLDPSVISDYEDVQITPLPKEAMWAAVISWLIFVVIFTAIASTAATFLNFPYLMIALSVILVVAIVVGILINISYRYRGYALREHDMIFQSGMLWRKRTVLPFRRVQHVETQQGILQRHFGLTSLKLFTAGGHKADLSITGMDAEVTESIKHQLLGKIADEPEQDD